MPKKFNMADVLSGKSIGITTPQDAQGFAVRQIPLKKIRCSGNNRYGIRDIEELAATIEAVGLMHNIVVRETIEPEVYEIVSGERRFRAYQLLLDGGNEEYKTIPCKVESQGDDDLSELRLLFANSTARDLNDFEKTYQAIRIKELLLSLKTKGIQIKGRIRDIVANMMEVSPAQVGRMEKIHGNLISGFMKEFQSGNIGITTAYDIAVLAKDEQTHVLEEYKKTGTEAIKKATAKESASQATKEHDEQENQHMANEAFPISKAEQHNQTVERERRTVEPSRANKAQRAILIDFGKKAVRDLCKLTDSEQRAEITLIIKVLTTVATAFGIHDYYEEIYTIPKQNKEKDEWKLKNREPLFYDDGSKVIPDFDKLELTVLDSESGNYSLTGFIDEKQMIDFCLFGDLDVENNDYVAYAGGMLNLKRHAL